MNFLDKSGVILLWNKIQEVIARAISFKVDKIDGKGLSTNDYTDEDKAKVEDIEQINISKVDKIDGKGLSTNDYTDEDKAKVEDIEQINIKTNELVEHINELDESTAQLEEQMIEVKNQSVKSVNNIKPDNNGNINISGLPEGSKANQVLVTDNNNIAGWADRGHFPSIVLTDYETGYQYTLGVYNGTLVTKVAIIKINVATMPNKIEYVEGEYFDPTGLTFTITLSDGTEKTVDGSQFDYSTNYLTVNDGEYNVYYEDSGMIYMDTIALSIIPFDPTVILIDFDYTDNGDGTYTITGWKETYNGEPSTEMIVPNYGYILV